MNKNNYKIKPIFCLYHLYMFYYFLACTELVLKQEQEEYRREGIDWEEIKYFNNQVICDLVEQQHKGVFAIIDEACLNVGKVTDEVTSLSLSFSLRKADGFETSRWVLVVENSLSSALFLFLSYF